MHPQLFFLKDMLSAPHFRDALNAIPAAVFVKDEESRIVLMNRGCEEQWGMSFDKICGTNGSHLFPRQQMDWFLAKDRELFRSGRQVECEEPYWSAKRKENRIGYTVKKPFFDSTGKPQYLVGITIDITERKNAETQLRMSDDKLRELFELAPIGIALNDFRGHFIEFNDAFLRICGYSADELRALDYWAVTPKEYAEQDALQLQSLAQRGCYGPYYKEIRHKDGTRIPVQLNGVRIYDADGRPYVWSIVEDISKQKRLEETMKLASLIYQSSSEGILVTDEHNAIVDVNPAFTRMTGYELAEIKGKNPNLMQSGMHGKEFYQQFWQAIHERGSWQGEMWDRHKDGQLMAKWVNVSAIRDADDRVFRYVAQFSDITEKKQRDELVWRQANYDHLTGLPNRRLFRDRLDQAVKKSNRTGLPLALMFIDLDHFKEINDTLGHDKGDLVLAEVAQRLRRCVRETDNLARLAGDEFTVIIPEYDSVTTVERIAERLIRELQAPYKLDTTWGHVSASIGISIYTSNADKPESLLQNADKAMYDAKAQGRNRYAFFVQDAPVQFMGRTGQERSEAKTTPAASADDVTADLIHKLIQQNKELAETCRLKTEFLAGFSHELRTPLNAIIGFTELLKDGVTGSLTNQQNEFVTQVFDSATHLLELINEILDLSKIEVGKMTLELDHVQINPLLQKCLSIFSQQAYKKSVTLTFEPVEGDDWMAVDIRKVRQIAFNLLSNAMKFVGERGNVHMALRKTSRKEVTVMAPDGMVTRLLDLPDSACDEFLEVRISDDGAGIHAVELVNLFRRFSQVSSPLVRQQEGTGLGLALVSELVALHGGTVAVASAQGKGSKFFAWLPWRRTKS